MPPEGRDRTRCALRALVILAVLAATVRVLAFSALDQRPHFGFAEGSDLQRSIAYHLGARHALDWNWLGQVVRDGFKPPLWFGGIPLLAGASDLLRPWHFLAVHAVLLLLSALALHAATAKTLGTGAAWIAPLLFVAAPGTASAFVQLGVEPVHCFVFAAWPLADLRAREGRWALLAALLAVGLLSKWTFAAYAALPLLVLLWGPAWRPTLKATLVGTAPFLLWTWFAADLTLIRAGAAAEPTFADPWSDEALLFVPRALVGALGPAIGLSAIVAAVITWRRHASAATPGPPRSRAAPPAALGALALVASLLLVHTLVPHKEERYLAPVLGPLVFLLAGPLSRLPLPIALLAPFLAVVLWPRPPAQDLYVARPLVLWPDADDYGFQALAEDPTFQRWERSILTFSIGPEQHFPLLAALQGELYLRSTRPLVPRYDHPSATDPACAYDLERSTHFLTNRSLDADEDAALRSMRYAPVAFHRLRLDGVPPAASTVTLWARTPAGEPDPVPRPDRGFTNP